VGIGFLGAGYRARSHISVFSKLESARLVAVCDVQKEKAKTVAKEFNIPKFYSDYEEMLRDREVEAVVVATPDYMHGEHNLKALQAGKHVLSEIPLAYTYEECEKIVRAVEGSGLKFFFGQETRYWVLFKALKDKVEEGYFGELFYVETEYLHNLEHPYNLFEATPWRVRQDIMLGGGPHAVDIMRWISGSEPVEVQAYGSRKAVTRYIGVNDIYVAIFKMDNGCISRVVTAAGMVRPYSLSIRLYGLKSSFEQDTLPWSLGGKVCLLSEKGFDLKQFKVPPEPEVPVKVHGAADYLQALDFLKSIIEDKEPFINVYEGAGTTVACIAAVKAANQGKKVKVPRF